MDEINSIHIKNNEYLGFGAEPEDKQAREKRTLLEKICNLVRVILLSIVILVEHVLNGSIIRFKATDLSGIEKLPSGQLGAEISGNLKLSTDPAETFNWKKRCILEAKNSIEISGNYCGGTAFNELLKLMEIKLKDGVKIRILLSSNLLSKEQLAKVKKLEKDANFEAVLVPGVWDLFPGVKRKDNHSKIIVVDQKYFVMGGTGITDRELPEYQFRNTHGKGRWLSDGNIDMDVVGEGEEFAETLKMQYDRLWFKWKRIVGKKANPNLDTGISKIPSKDKCSIDEFEGDNTRTKLIVGSPEHSTRNNCTEEYIQMIRSAEKTLYIANMVFNEESIINELKKAAERGVQIKVLTNNESSGASKSITPRNRLNYKRLVSFNNVELYEYDKANELFHVKSMIVDRKKALIGSFNISKESSKCDDELLLVADSEKFVNKELDYLESLPQARINAKRMKKPDFLWSTLKGRVLEPILRNVIN